MDIGKRSLVGLLLMLWLGSNALCQTTSISGYINIYTPVITAAPDFVTVGSATGFKRMNRVLIIQMKGATVDLTNTSNFGSVTNYNNAGNYEFATISSVSGDTITFLRSLANQYDPAHIVQLVRIPTYEDVTVNDTVLAQHWNGSIGGVLAFEACGNVTLNGVIDASGAGFHGGNISALAKGCDSLYFCTHNSANGADKGEGIASIPAGYESGRGAFANAGGGGDIEEGGGGGGSNSGAGGNGGEKCPKNGGIGGYLLQPVAGKIFMGGGGGGGHYDDQFPESNQGIGTAGGGIIIIRANTITGNGYTINASGRDVPYSSVESAGGGGGGGTILLDVQDFVGPIHIVASGGNGGNTSDVEKECVGAGGGGSGGLIWMSGQQPFGKNIAFSFLGGNGGTSTRSDTLCPNKAAATGDKGQLFDKLQISGGIPLVPTIAVPTITANGPTKFCAGDSVKVLLTTESGYFSYLWSTGDTTQSILVTAPGTYSVSVTDGGASVCDTLTSSPIKISVLPKTKTPRINGLLVLCNGSSAVLTASSGYMNYLWSDGAITQSDTIHQPGTYTLTVTDSNGCKTDTSFTVTSGSGTVPVVTVSPSATFCIGDSVTLTADTGYSAYLWSNGDTSRTITVHQSGAYTVTALSVSGCPGTSAQINTIALPAPRPTISGVLALCGGSSAMLDAGAGYENYLWSNGDTTRIITVTQPGTYSVTVTDSEGCAGTSPTVNVTLGNVPTANAGPDATICAGDTAMLTGSGTGTNPTYQWSPATGLSCTTCAHPLASPGTTTKYYLTVTDTGGCTNIDSATVFVQPHLMVTVDTNVINFDTALVGTIKRLIFTVRNPSADTIHIYSVRFELQTQFGIHIVPSFTIPPGDSTIIGIEYLPVKTQKDSDYFCIRIKDTCNDSLCLTIYGTGYTNAKAQTAELCADPLIPSAPLDPMFCTVNLLNNITTPIDSLVFDLDYDPAMIEFINAVSPRCGVTAEHFARGIERIHLSGCGAPLNAGPVCIAQFAPLVSASDTAHGTLTIDSIQFYPVDSVIASGCSVPVTVLPACGLYGVYYIGATSLAQNHPNPFSGTTTIHETLSPSDIGHAQLLVYNMMGTLVADLSSQVQQYGDVIFSSEGLPSGTYIYALITPTRRFSRIMTVME